MKETKSSGSVSDAVFIGWQQNFSGDAFALYNILKVNHPSRGSTVSEKTLNMLNLQVPKQHYSKAGKKYEILGKVKKTDE